MPNGMVPPGYTATLIGSATTYEELNTVTPLEEGSAEGTLMLMRLDFAEYPSAEALSKLAADLEAAGVPTWPGYTSIVYQETEAPSIYIAWQKGFAWMPIIIGILVLTLLPTLLGAFIWWLLPQSIKDLIVAMVNFGILFLMMMFMSKVMVKEPKRLEGGKG